MKLNTIKSLKAERETLTQMLSNATSEEAKNFIINELELLNIRIEERIAVKRWATDMGLFLIGSVVGNVLVNKTKGKK